MVESTALLLSNLESELKIIRGDEENNLNVYKYSLEKIAFACREFSKELDKYPFESKEEEVFTYKYLMPQMFSKLFYFNNLLKLESEIPQGSDCNKIKFIQKKLRKLYRHCEDYAQLYQYYHTGETKFDLRYFEQRCAGEILYNHAGLILYNDNNYSCPNGLVFSEIIANEQTEKILNDELKRLNNPNPSENKELAGKAFTLRDFKWTKPKRAFVEFIYFIQAGECVNDGKEDTITIIKYFAKILKVEIDDPYKIYNEIKLRSNRTQFLDDTREKLLRKMDEEDMKE